LVFFIQAEDGIRERTVTGVQTCALPICTREAQSLPSCRRETARSLSRAGKSGGVCGSRGPAGIFALPGIVLEDRRSVPGPMSARSEERRVGKDMGCWRCGVDVNMWTVVH